MSYALVSNLHLMATSKEEIHLKVRRSAPSRRFVLFYLFVIGLCLAVTYGFRKYSRASGNSKAVAKDPELVWTTVSIIFCGPGTTNAYHYLSQLPPSPVDSLVWISCYMGLQCAKMAVKRDASPRCLRPLNDVIVFLGPVGL